MLSSAEAIFSTTNFINIHVFFFFFFQSVSSTSTFLGKRCQRSSSTYAGESNKTVPRVFTSPKASLPRWTRWGAYFGWNVVAVVKWGWTILVNKYVSIIQYPIFNNGYHSTLLRFSLLLTLPNLLRATLQIGTARFRHLPSAQLSILPYLCKLVCVL